MCIIALTDIKAQTIEHKNRKFILLSNLNVNRFIVIDIKATVRILSS